MAKYIANVSGTLTEVSGLASSAGAGDAGKIPQLDAAGRIDASMMPVGIGADTAAITASEALSAGDLVNVWNSGGPKVRKADATTAGKRAHGFVLSAVANGATATDYYERSNTAVTGLTAVELFLATTAGGVASAAPSAAGQVVQRVGWATSATSLNFQAGEPITLA